MVAKPLFAVLAVAALAVAGLAVALSNAPSGALHIAQVRFLKGDAEGQNLTLTALLYLSSINGSSRDVRIVAYLYPRSTGIADQRLEVSVGEIGAARTREVRIPLTLAGFDATQPHWGVDFLVFEDGLLTQEGHGSIGYRGPPDLRVAADMLIAEAGEFQQVR